MQPLHRCCANFLAVENDSKTGWMSEKRIQWRRRDAGAAEEVGISEINSASLLRDIIPRLRDAVDFLASKPATEIDSMKPGDIATSLMVHMLSESDAERKNAEKAIDGMAPEMLVASEPYSEYLEIIGHEKAVRAELEGSPDAVMLDAIEAMERERWLRLKVVIYDAGEESRKLRIMNAAIYAIKEGWPFA